MKRKKVLAVASIGGHWIQLLRIVKPMEKYYDVVYFTTLKKSKTMVGDKKFHCLMDFNRWNLWKIIPAFFKVLAIIAWERPAVIITTGAAPGLITLMVGRMFRIKTIWIDSVANVNKLSKCGSLASMWTRNVYTQWPALANGRVHYIGNVFEN